VATRLKNVQVDEISLVDKAANRKRFFLAKRDSTSNKPAEVAVQSTNEPVIEPVGKRMENEKNSPAPVELPKPEPVVFLKADGEPDVAALAKLDPVTRTQVEAVFKARADLAAEKAELTKRLAAEQDAKDLAECVRKCETDFKNLPVTAAELGADLRALRKADKPLAERFEALLAKANVAVAKVLEPIGSVPNHAAEGMSTWEKVQKRAEEMLAKGEVKSFALGVQKVIDSEPQLYPAIEAEKVK
jgi:uncharacterized protein GlcG (DUF336 family)